MAMIPAGFKAFFASRIQNASGVLLDGGTLGVIPTDENDVPTSAVAGGVGGAITNCEDKTTVSAGKVSGFIVADTEAATPKIFYRLIIRDAAGVPIFILRKVQTLNAVFDLDTYLTGASSTLASGVTFIDTVTSAHINLTIANGAKQYAAGSDIGTPVAGITFIDQDTGAHFNLTVASGIESLAAGSDIGTPVASISFVDTVAIALFVLSVKSGALSLA